MKFDLDHINAAIVHALAELLCGDAQYSAKELQGTLGAFFIEAAGKPSPETAHETPKEYCYPYRADPASLARMCEAIFAEVSFDTSCRHSQLKLIQKIYQLSEAGMEGFREAKRAGTYGRNDAYISPLLPDNDWGRWMLALKEAFFEKTEKVT